MLFCTDCHSPGTAMNAAPNTCVGCHAEDDVHLLQMGATCNDCHNESSWQDARFDHSTTDFLLVGRHQEATCTACHTDHVYNGVPTDCASCHDQDDVHNGRNGAQCGSCHSSNDWQPEFDHVAASQFPLLGAHESLTCESCHTQNLSESLPTSCHGCHQSEDVHSGGLGTDCGSCHRVSGWANTGFDHDDVQAFPLLGAHTSLECSSCHVADTAVALPTTCIGCHTTDPHVGQLGNQCGSCHMESDWVDEINFDHGLSLFPLIGLHMSVGCEDCHATLAFHDAASDCSACHASSDVHDGRLGPQCETCHSPVDWAEWHFDHDSQTNFPLTGAHQGASCAGCHQESTSGPVTAPAVCEQCHRRDDPHAGSFGADCGGCHTTDSFSEVRGF